MTSAQNRLLPSVQCGSTISGTTETSITRLDHRWNPERRRSCFAGYAPINSVLRVLLVFSHREQQKEKDRCHRPFSTLIHPDSADRGYCFSTNRWLSLVASREHQEKAGMNRPLLATVAASFYLINIIFFACTKEPAFSWQM